MKTLNYFRGIYTEAKSLRAVYSSRWDEIARFVGITSAFSVNPTAATDGQKTSIR